MSNDEIITGRIGRYCPACGEENGCGECEGPAEPEGLVVEYLGPFVNVYRIDKAYGGPEEGGWWYEYGEALRSKQVLPDDEEAIEAEKAKQQAWCNEQNEGRRTNINSVLSEGKYVVRVEDWPAEHYPRETPHYE